jgi:phosphoglycerate dehydrogenase-like enzyme
VKYFDTVSNTQQEWLDRVQGVDIIYSEEPFMHENLPYIKNCFLTFPFTAFLKQVDIDELKVHNVITASAKGGNKYAVAERNIMALLHLTRNFSQINMTKENLAWSFLSSITGVRDLEVIILGKGNIGTVTGELCQ